MFTDISWEQYISLVIIALLLYYSLIIMGLYYQEFRKLRRRGATSNSTPKDPQEVSTTPFAETSEETFREVEQLTVKLKDTIAEAFRNNYIRKELLDSLAHVLRQHPTLQHSPFQAAIHELIASECEKYGPVGFREDELTDLWKMKT